MKRLANICGRFLIAVLLAAATPAQAESRYVRHDASNRQVIVFVHGVLGNSTETWTNPDSGAYFPALLTQDHDFDGTDIFVVDYPSPRVGTSLSIDELAESLRLTLESNRVFDHSEVVIVAHSMGGLVTRAYLLKYRDAAKKVKLLYFFATPTTGSSVASIARLASRNPQFARMMPMTSDAYLADVLRTWLAAPEMAALPSFCAYELQDTLGFKVVEQQSATNLCNRRLDPVDRTHSGIVKPRGRDDTPYLALKGAYATTSPAAAARSLRLQVEGLQQIRPTLERAPQIQGAIVYCAAVRLTLMLAHAQRGSAPIRVNALSVHSEPVREAPLPQAGSCAVDTLASRPHGIVETDVFRVTSEDSGIKARFMKDATHSIDVTTDNLLRSSTSVRAVTLKPGEEPVAFEVLIEVHARTPQRLWFTADYDEDGPRTLTTPPIIVWR